MARFSTDLDAVIEVDHRFGEETLNYMRKDVVVNAILRQGKVTNVQKTGGAG